MNLTCRVPTSFYNERRRARRAARDADAVAVTVVHLTAALTEALRVTSQRAIRRARGAATTTTVTTTTTTTA